MPYDVSCRFVAVSKTAKNTCHECLRKAREYLNSNSAGRTLGNHSADQELLENVRIKFRTFDTEWHRRHTWRFSSRKYLEHSFRNKTSDIPSTEKVLDETQQFHFIKSGSGAPLSVKALLAWRRAHPLLAWRHAHPLLAWRHARSRWIYVNYIMVYHATQLTLNQQNAQAVLGCIIWAFRRLKKPRGREMNGLHSVCPTILYFSEYRYI